ncbi:MAG TPA: nucleotide disphospho-sugar-binding domain-containing protein [Solirubrobacteraceae bacterium]|jgi:MGT family glycosyltransferase|nr:nucleotide disphospho-sugar-binding domain-containing protein [Solirubrobacteraceae bacterium]
MRVLAYTSPARGHLYPIVPIMAELVARGHRASVCTLSGELGHLARLGIEGSAIDPAVESIQIEDWRKRSPRSAGLSVLRTFTERADGEAPDLARAIERYSPDVLLIDVNCWGGTTVAEASGLPWAVYSPYLLPLPSRDAPPFGLGLRPLGGPIGRVRDAIVGRVFSATFDRAVMPTINTLRARRGLPALERYTDLLGSPPLLLALTAEGFEYRRGDWPANVRLVGAVNWSPPLPAPPWLADLRDPLVLVTCSTERQRDKRLLHVALQALPAAGMTVLGTSAAHDPLTFSAPSGSRVVRFLPHEAVLERAACVVCHGGMGITQKALAAETPVVVVPCGRDQLDTARRVESAGAGVRLSPRRLTPERLVSAVRGAIGLREGARRVSRAYAAAGGAVAAADAIEAVARMRTR